MPRGLGTKGKNLKKETIANQTPAKKKMTEGRPYGSKTLQGNWVEDRTSPAAPSGASEWVTTAKADFGAHDVQRRKPAAAPVPDSLMTGHGPRQEDWDKREMATMTSLTMHAKMNPGDVVDPMFVPEPQKRVGAGTGTVDTTKMAPAGKPTDSPPKSTVRSNALGNTLDDPMHRLGLRKT